MKTVIRWAFAGALATAVALFGSAQAQGYGGGSSDTAGSTESRGDTGGPTPGGADRSTADQPTTPQGGAAGTSSDSGMRQGTSGGTATGTTPGSTMGKAPSGRASKDLQERLEKFHAANQAEVQMGQLGMEKAQSPDVKQFAEHMQTDHQKVDQKLTQTAQSAGITSLEGTAFTKESDKAKKDMEKLQSKSGRDFDKAFMSQLVKDHEKALKDVEKARDDARKANQTELASLLDQAHTGMKGHLDHAKQIEKSLSRGGQQAQGRRATEGGTGAGAPSGGGQRKTQ